MLGGFVPTREEEETRQPWLPSPEPTPQPLPAQDWEFGDYFSDKVQQRVTPPVEEPDIFVPGLVGAKARIEKGWLTTWLRERAEERSTFLNNAALGLARNLGWANEKFAASLGVSLERDAKVDFPQYLKKAFMPPIPGQEVGKVWESLYGLVFRQKDRPNSVMVEKGKQIVGFMLRQPMIQSYDVWNMDAKLHLSQGTWQSYIESYPTPGGVTAEDHERNVQLATGIQTNYNQLFEDYLNEGMPIWEAQALASANALRAGQKEKKEYFNFKAWAERTFTEEGAEAFARGERVAPFSETSQENWDAAAGYRYSHSWSASSEQTLDAHKAALEMGMTPQQAGDQSEDPKIERWAEFLFDPNWVIPLDNLLIRGLWKIVKPAGKGVLKLGKWFSVKTGFSHFIENTVQTIGAHTAFNVKDALRVSAGALDQYGPAAIDVLEKHSDDFMGRIPQFMRRAVMNAQPYIDDIRKVFTEIVTDDAVGEVSARLIREAARTGVELAEDVATHRASRELFERALTRVGDVVASIAKENVADTMPKTLRMLADSRGMKFISAITTKLNSTFVDVWLSLRPSFLIYNQTDGIVKTFLTGINPFNSLGDLLKRYGKFSPYGVDAATEAAETYGKRHFWSILFKGQNEDLLRAIGATIPETAKGSFGVARAYKPSFLRRLPLVGSVIDWSRSASGVIEVVGRSRLYLSSYLKYVDEGYDALLRNVWRTRYLEKMSGELGDYFSQRMGAADALSVDEVLKIADNVLEPGRQRVVVSNLANYPRPDAIPQPVYGEVQQRLMALTDEAAASSGIVSRVDIERVFRETAEGFIEQRNAAIETARKFFADSLPGRFESADEMYEALLYRPGMKIPSDFFNKDMLQQARLADAIPGAKPRVIGTVGDLIIDPKLREQYAAILHVEVRTLPGVGGTFGGLYDQLRQEISLSSTAGPVDILHELDHAYRRITGKTSTEALAEFAERGFYIPTMEDYARAVDDMPMVAKSQRLREGELLTEHYATQRSLRGKIREGTGTWTEWHANHDMFFGARQARFAEFYEWQAETFRRFADDVDALQLARSGRRIPRDFFNTEMLSEAQISLQELRRKAGRGVSVGKRKIGKIGDLITDPKLRKQYAMLLDRDVWADPFLAGEGYAGTYARWAAGDITLGPGATPGTILHELDHAYRDVVGKTITEEAAELSGRGFYLPGPTFNRQLLDDYLGAVRQYNEFELLRDKIRTELAEKWPVMSWEKGQAEKVLADLKLDKVWSAVKHEADDVMHRSLVGVRQWFMDEGFGVPRHLYDPTQLAENVGWWRHLDQVDSFPDDVVRQHSPAFKALSDWEENLYAKRTRPFTERVVGDTEGTVVRAFRDAVSQDMTQLGSDAMETAVNLTNDTFFDYSTTNNLQNLIGKVVPFWRFTSKNMPWWVEKFGTVSHLTVGVQHIRQIQAAANAHLPERMKYTAPIPLSAEIRGALGFDAVPIRVNPWIYFSFMQNIPGGTPYKMRQLSELPMNEEDADMLPGREDLLTYAEQMGFGRWPYVDWLLGVYGLEGDDWYPREAFSTWSPVVDWAVREVTNYEKGFNIDRFMWENAPKIWNSLFGDTVFAWPYMNPTLFEDWSTGREVEGIFTDMSVEQQRILETMNPSEMHEQLNGLRESGTYDTIRASIMPVFELSEEEQTLALADLSPDALAVYWEEINKIARRKAVRKKAAASVFGHLTGMYPSVVNTTELIARKLRYEKRLEKEMLGPGPEYRDFEKTYRYEHPGYGLGQAWRFGQFPWAETEAGLEAERWDAMIQDATGEYWERYTEWQQEYNQGWKEVYAKNPNDVIGLAAFRDESFKARDAMEKYYDDLVTRRLTESMEKYELEHPGDVQGIAMLREGFETTMYVGTHITEDQRQQLANYREKLPEDKEGLTKLFQGFWKKASESKPPNRPHKWPGLDQGFSIKLDWNPSSHNLEELEERRIADVVYALKDLQPQYDDFDNTADYYLARDEFFETLPEQIMKVPEAKARVEKLVADEGLSLAEAKETVANMYSPDEVMRYWQYARNPLEALEYAYKKRVYGPALDKWFTRIALLYDIDPDLYYAASEDFYKRYGEFDATDLIPYVMEDYPGKWTAVELHTAFAGMTMPAYRDRRREASRGESGLNSRIRYYYNQLPGEEKRQVRGAFGLPFVETFLAGQPNDLSVELRGDWLTTLTEMVGVEFDYHTIPDIDEVELQKQSREDKREFGLPYVGPPDMEEYALAEKLNERYWALRQAGDERYQEIAVNPVWQKWFGKATSKSYFWNFYYRSVPPGWVGKELRENPLVQLLLDKGIRNTVASNTDYDRAVNLMESWLILNSETLRDLDYNPAEYEEVRRLMNEFFDLPTNEAKTAFKEANPLLAKYLDKPSVAAKKITTTRGYSSGYGYGGGRARAKPPAQVDYRPIWSAFRTRTGQSFITVLRMLTSYWRTGNMTEQVKTYLSSLHAEIGGELSFESWLGVLRTAWLAQSTRRTTGGVRVPPRPKIVRPYYEQDRIRGRRRA